MYAPAPMSVRLPETDRLQRWDHGLTKWRMRQCLELVLAAVPVTEATGPRLALVEALVLIAPAALPTADSQLRGTSPPLKAPVHCPFGQPLLRRHRG